MVENRVENRVEVAVNTCEQSPPSEGSPQQANSPPAFNPAKACENDRIVTVYHEAVNWNVITLQKGDHLIIWLVFAPSHIKK